MIDINDYGEEKTCLYEDETYLVRDNGSVMRLPKQNKKPRQLDNIWTFGKANYKTGYLEHGKVRIHRIIATAFHGSPPAHNYVVDHIDTNRQNNRPSNLRWVTRFENTVFNPITRKKIEYLTGVEINEFLSDPNKYKDCFKAPDVSWMRSVTEEEAKACLENLSKFDQQKNKNMSKSSNGIGEWVYIDPKYSYANNGIQCTNPLVKLHGWRTPTEFPLCPEKVEDNPIENYFKKLDKGFAIAKNCYGYSIIENIAKVNNEKIVIISKIPSKIKNYALMTITFEDGLYVHASKRTFFEKVGAEKYFTLEQGLEWTGPDSIDDYC
jgi:hypothetical protein